MTADTVPTIDAIKGKGSFVNRNTVRSIIVSIEDIPIRIVEINPSDTNWNANAKRIMMKLAQNDFSTSILKSSIVSVKLVIVGLIKPVLLTLLAWYLIVPYVLISSFFMYHLSAWYIYGRIQDYCLSICWVEFVLFICI